jgi:mannosyltransferase OCH1-like enzyme
MDKLHQIILRPYDIMPEYLINHHFELNGNDLEYTLYNNDTGLIIIKENFGVLFEEAFINGKGKWCADLLRFCIMSTKSGLYIDVDLVCKKPIKEFGLPDDIDTVLCLGGIFPLKKGIYPLPFRELAIGFLYCKTPDPLFREYMNQFNPKKIANPPMYAYNTQSLYKFISERLQEPKLKAFQVYLDKESGRKYYFIEEVRIENNWEMVNSKGDIIVRSQHVNHKEFQKQ